MRRCIGIITTSILIATVKTAIATETKAKSSGSAPLFELLYNI